MMTSLADEAVSPPRFLCFAHPHMIRTRFARAMSNMYRKEMSLYDELLDIVSDANAPTVRARPTSMDIGPSAPARVRGERNGAIRLGTKLDLSTMRGIFAAMGARSFGYSDFTKAAALAHAKAFRPTTAEALAANPFPPCEAERSASIDVLRGQLEEAAA